MWSGKKPGHIYKLLRLYEGALMMMNDSNLVKIGLENEECRADWKIRKSPDTMTICGRVFNSATCRAVSNVGIKLTDTEYNPLFHTISDINGEFVFANLPFQYYILIASCFDYFTSTSILISPCPLNSIQEIPLNPLPTSKQNIITGKITDINNEPLENCIIKLFSRNNKNALCYTTTDCDGNYILTFKNRHNVYYYLSVIHCSYKSKTIDVPDDYKRIYCIDAKLSVDKYAGGTINGVITDVTGNPVAHCVVVLFDADNNKPILFTYTNQTGCYLFYDIKVGNYFIKANKQFEEKFQENVRDCL